MGTFAGTRLQLVGTFAGASLELVGTFAGRKSFGGSGVCDKLVYGTTGKPVKYDFGAPAGPGETQFQVF